MTQWRKHCSELETAKNLRNGPSVLCFLLIVIFSPILDGGGKFARGPIFFRFLCVFNENLRPNRAEF